MSDAVRAEFCAKYGEEILEELCEAIWGNKSRVTIVDLVRHNAINCSGLATFDWNGEEVEFSFRDGDWNGTEVLSFGESCSYNPPKPQKRIAILDEHRIKMEYGEERLEVMRELFRLKKAEIDEMMGKMNYDLYFSPTTKIRQHYNEWLKKNYLTTDWVDV